MADVETAHPAKRHMHEIIRADGDHRAGHDIRQLHVTNPCRRVDRDPHLPDNVPLGYNPNYAVVIIADKDTV